MPITSITEIINPELLPKKKTILKEKMDIFIPDIITNSGLPNRNGGIVFLIGAGGSGKTQLLLSLFSSSQFYKNKFHNLYYVCPMSSFLSLEKHPFAKHDKVYHELTPELLDTINGELTDIKENSPEQEYSCVILDDVANFLKEKDIETKLNKMLIKARHLGCMFIFVVQSYLLIPKIFRKQATNAIIYKSNNVEEWESITKELLHKNKEDASKIYDFVFDKMYNHLDIDTKTDKLYKNFNFLQIQ